MNKHVCIHGHFYQPPRENAWLEYVEVQDSAYPYHDWNERVTAEAYAPNAASRILNSEKKIIDIVSNYSKMSFDCGPTLLSWMEKKKPDIYEAIIQSDKESREHFGGHGSALAQVYNHMIMPLANERDKHTQVLWGIKDFEHRFGRSPEGMWLPETAVDLGTLDLLTVFGIKFTILSPHQAARVRKKGEKAWTEVRGGAIDTRHAYLCHLPSGRSIALFFYNGEISHEVSFGNLLSNGEHFAHRLLQAFSGDSANPQLVHIATDGETFGHHYKFGDMALSYCLHYIESRGLAQITVYGEHIEKYPPLHEVEIIENTSWSCAHGVERWRSDCGCNSGNSKSSSQSWRAPLRKALDWLRDSLAALYEKSASPLCEDPWTLRNDYIHVLLDRTTSHIRQFLAERAPRPLAAEEQIALLKLLEMQRHAMFMYTSCGWFFDEISGIETRQILQYASRAMQLAEEVSGTNCEPRFIKMLEKAASNIPEFKDGGRIYTQQVRPARVDQLRFGAHYAISSLFEQYTHPAQVYSYSVTAKNFERIEIGKQKFAAGSLTIRSNITLEEKNVNCIALHLGGHILNAWVNQSVSPDKFNVLQKVMADSFKEGDIPALIRLMDNSLPSYNYSLWHLFTDEQRVIFNKILESTLLDIEAHFKKIYEDNYATIQTMGERGIPCPKIFLTTMEFVLNAELKSALKREPIDLEELKEVIGDCKKLSVTLDLPVLRFIASNRIHEFMKELYHDPEDIASIQLIHHVLDLLSSLQLPLDLWEVQNIFFYIGKKKYKTLQGRTKRGGEAAAEWLSHFDTLGNYLGVKCC